MPLELTSPIEQDAKVTFVVADSAPVGTETIGDIQAFDPKEAAEATVYCPSTEAWDIIDVKGNTTLAFPTNAVDGSVNIYVNGYRQHSVNLRDILVGNTDRVKLSQSIPIPSTARLKVTFINDVIANATAPDQVMAIRIKKWPRHMRETLT